MDRLRTCSGCLETSVPPSSTVPAVRRNVPAMALSSVDLPDPFEPMMLTNWPGGHVEVDPGERHDLVDRAREEDLARPVELQRRRGAHTRTTLLRTVGTDSAATTRTAVSSFRSVGAMPKRRLTAISSR